MKKSIILGSIIAVGVLFASCGDKSADADGYSGATKKNYSNKLATSNADWWPNQLNVSILRQHSSLSNPMDEDLIMLLSFRSWTTSH